MEQLLKPPIFIREEARPSYRFRTGIAELDAALGGGIPANLTVTIMNDPGNDVSTFCQQICWQGLNDNEVVVYLTYDQHPDVVRQNMTRFGWDISKFEKHGYFILVDCFSARIGERGNGKYWIEKPFDSFQVLSFYRELEKEIRMIRGKHPLRVVMDSFSSLVHVINFADTVKLVLKLQGLAKKGVYTGFGVVHKGIHGLPNEFIAKHVANGVIELITREKNENLKQYIKITKMNLTKFSSVELPYIISENGVEII